MVLGTASREARASESQKLLNWGFTAWDAVRLFEAGKPMVTPEVWKGTAKTAKLGAPGPVFIAVPRGEGPPPAAREPGNPKVRQGVVVSDKMDKTITVRVESARRHPAYEKVIRTSKMYHAHDERNEAGAGDTVRLVETRPMSKTKRWRLTEILEKAK